MAVINVILVDEVHLYVNLLNKSIEKELKEFLSLDPLQTTSKKNNNSKKQDRVYHLYNPDKNKRLYVGSFPRLERFAKDYGYTIRKSHTLETTKNKRPLKGWIMGPYDENEDFYGKDIRRSLINEEQFRKEIKKLEVSDGQSNSLDDSPPFFSHTHAREYETTAMLNALNRKRAILLFRPEDNRHLVMCHLIRLWIKNNKKCLFLVSNEMDVDRFYEGFCKSFVFIDGSYYGGFCETSPEDPEAEKFCLDRHIQKPDAKHPGYVSESVFLADLESVKNQPPEWFDKFDIVIADEINKFSRSLTPLMEKITKAEYRIGLMNSTENLKIHRQVLEGLFGPVEEVWDKTTPKEYRSDLDVTCIQLNYPDEIKEARKKLTHQDQEVKFLQECDKRNRYIRNLACDLKGSTLITVMNISHGEILRNLISEKIQRDWSNKEVFLIDKDNIANIGETDGWIVIVPYIRIEDGFPIHSLDNVLLAHPCKKGIRNLNAIGSGLKSRNEICKIYDIVDDLRLEDWDNHLIKQAHESMEIYEEEKKWGLLLKKVSVSL